MNFYRVFFSLVFCVGIFGRVWAGVVVLNGLTHENTVQPGETYRVEVEVQNSGAEEQSVRLYMRDYWYNYKGESRHDDPGTMERSNANWVVLPSELLTLAPMEKRVVTLEVKVPEDSTLVGSYWSVLMVEGVLPPDTTQRQGVSIRTSLRYAVQIITNIGGSGSSKLDFINIQLSKDEETTVVQVMLENTGQRLLRPAMSIELFDQQGNSVATLKAPSRKVLPGTSVTIPIELTGVEPGIYSGVLIADCGGDNLYGTNVSFEIK